MSSRGLKEEREREEEDWKTDRDLVSQPDRTTSSPIIDELMSAW